MAFHAILRTISKCRFRVIFFAKTFRLDYFLRFSKKVIRTSINHYRGGKISTQSSILCTFPSISSFFFCPSYPPLCGMFLCFSFFPPYHLSSCIVSQDKGHFLEIVRILSLKLQLNFLDILWLGIIGLATALLET